MEIRSIEALEGANVYSSKPIIKMFLNLGPWTGKYTNELGDFVTEIIQTVPSLNEHFCSRGRPGGFVERLKEGTLLGHVVEHVALELMSLAGQKVIYGKTLGTDEPGLYEIVMEYEVKEGAIRAAQSAVLLVTNILSGRKVSLADEVDKIKQAVASSGLGPSTAAIEKACRERDIPVLRLNSGSLLQLGYGIHQKRVQATVSGNTSCIGVDISCDKTLTKQLLVDAAIPVPMGVLVNSEEDAIAAAKDLGMPVVIKPHNGNQGKGVTLNLETEAQVRAAYKLAIQHSDKVIVERYVEGRHYRLVVVGDKVEAVAERIPAHIVGDGKKTIQQLINEINSDPLRGDEHELPLTKIKVDSAVLFTLVKKGYSLETVLPRGEILYLRESANLSTGGTAIDLTDQAHPSYFSLAVRAAKIIGLDIAGIDLVTPDITLPYSSVTSAIIEVNAAPGIRMHHFPTRGVPRNVAKAIVDYLFPTNVPARIPIISITGTNGKTTTTRLISHILRQRGLTVGTTDSDGIYIGDTQVLAGDTTGPASAQMVLRDPEVDVAVLETARGGILRAGLGYDFADVAVVTNISEDHFGQYGIDTLDDLAHVKSVVVENVRKHSFVVLNADDPYVSKMAIHTKGKVIFFSTMTDSALIKQHLSVGGTAVFIKRGKIIVATGNEVVRVGSVKSFPITYEGKALHNVANVLAAVGAVWAVGIREAEIRQALMNFYTDQQDNPGRLNIFEVNGFSVMVDYGHNEAGIEQIIAFAKKFNYRRLIGVVTVPGDRPDESIYKVGKLSGKGFDYLFVREDVDLRGRKPGEVAEIIKSAAVLSGMKDKNIKTILPETKAFKAALDFAGPRDLVIHFYEKLDPVLTCLNNYLANTQKLLPEKAVIYGINS